MAHGDAWGGSWNGFWGGSWGEDAVVTPPTPTPTITTAGGVGASAWRNYYKRDKLPKKKKELVEELDEMILELRERIMESPAADEADYERQLRVSQALAMSDIAEISNAKIAAQIAILKRTIQEIDDEEVLLLALH